MSIEIERRFLIHAEGVPPDGWWPVPFVDSHIVQTYLTMPPEARPGATERVRMCIPADGGPCVHTHTTKNPLPPQATAGLTGGSQEAEREVPVRTYNNLKRRADPACVSVEKMRRVFTWPPTPEEGVQRVFELDIYAAPFGGLVVLEVELPSFDAEVVLPLFLPIDREVTKDRAYSNFGLARAGRIP